jgi:MFS family permease
MAQGWGDLLRGGNAGRCAVIGGGISMHAVNVFIVTTILPSVVHEIGGLRYFAWSTTLYVVASLMGGANTAQLMRRIGVRQTYRVALGCFALGCLICAAAPSMAVLLLGRLVQGLGAGVLSALSFSMVRLLFPQALWARAFSVVSVAWGIATLGGPAIGGIFAQYDAWRAAFWSLLGLTPILLLLVEINLPRGMARPSGPAMPVSRIGLALLAASALSVSTGSMATNPWLNGLGLAAAATGLLVFRRLEARGPARVLPRGACDPSTKLGGVYLAMLLLLLGVNSEIFVPYFLQVLHGMSPLHAGYLSALMSGGWSVASITSAASDRRSVMLQVGPLAMAAGLLVLFVLMPVQDGTSLAALSAMGVGLAAIGAGIGLCWPHLGAAVFAHAPEDERDLASASITTVIMVGNAFGSALGGMVTNVADVAQTPSHAASWLFALFALAPIGAALAVRRLR